MREGNEPRFEHFTAMLRLVGWFAAVILATGMLIPPSLRSAPPVSAADALILFLAVYGAFNAGRKSNFYPAFFTFGCCVGLLLVVSHMPTTRDMMGMPRGAHVIRQYGAVWIGAILSVGLLCRGAAMCGQHLTRLRFERERFGKCRACGYVLYGLPQPRCPECGQACDPRDITTPPDDRDS